MKKSLFLGAFTYEVRKISGIFYSLSPLSAFIMLSPLLGIILTCHALLHLLINYVQSGASGERLGWVELDLGCSTILLGQ